jgi:multiple sugar transport system permease protein
MSVAASLPQWQRREKLVALLLLGPAVLYLLALSIYPTIYSLWIAFHNYSLYRRDLVSFSGIDNFTDLLDSDVFKQSFVVTLVFAAAAVFIELVLGFAIAVLLDRKMRGANVLRTLGLTFRYIFAPTYGLLTYLLRLVHIPSPDWTVSVTWALPVVIFADVWQWTPFVALILLSGMQSVSTEVTEAAELDGLTEWQKLWRIVVPLIRPVLLVVVLIRLIDSIRMFDLVFVMTRGGPGSTTEVLSLFSYVTGFASGDMGSASAIAWVTVAIVNVLVAVFLRFLSKTA